MQWRMLICFNFFFKISWFRVTDLKERQFHTRGPATEKVLSPFFFWKCVECSNCVVSEILFTLVHLNPLTFSRDQSKKARGQLPDEDWEIVSYDVASCNQVTGLDLLFKYDIILTKWLRISSSFSGVGIRGIFFVNIKRSSDTTGLNNFKFDFLKHYDIILVNLW